MRSFMRFLLKFVVKNGGQQGSGRQLLLPTAIPRLLAVKSSYHSNHLLQQLNHHQQRTMSSATTTTTASSVLNGAVPSNSATKTDLDYVKKLKTLEILENDRFRSQTLVPGHPLYKDVFGGLIFAQSIAAAEMTVGKGFSTHAAHSFFIRKATIDRPIDYFVSRLREGRSFCTRLVQAKQDGQVVFCVQISLCTAEHSAIEHQTSMPKVPEPERLTPFFDLTRNVLREHEQGRAPELTERAIKNLKNTLLYDQIALFEIRPVEPKLYLGLQPHQVLPVRYWLKCLVPLGELGNEQSVNRFLLAYVTDATLVSTANRPHMSNGHEANMLLSLDHSVHFHDHNYRADEWLLCENVSPMAKNGRAFSLGNIWTRDGRLVLSCSQESLSRSRSTETSKLEVTD